MAGMKKSRKQNSRKTVHRIDKPQSAPAEVFVLVPYDYAVTVHVSFEVFDPRDAAKEELSKK